MISSSLQTIPLERNEAALKPWESFIKEANQAVPGQMFLRQVSDITYVVGKTDAGEVFVAAKAAKLGSGCFCDVFSCENCLNVSSENRYVIKIAKDKSKDLTKVARILEAVHAQEETPYVASCFMAKAFFEGENCICAGLQKREGLNLSVLSRHESRPALNFIVRALKENSDSLLVMGWKDLDQKSHNYALSIDRQRVVKIDVDCFFRLEEFASNSSYRFVTYTPEFMPIEGLQWLDLIFKIKKLETCNWNTVLMYKEHNISVKPNFKTRVFSVLKISDLTSKEEVQSILIEELRKVVDLIMNYQLGLTAYRYMTFDVDLFPYGLYEDKAEKKKFQQVSVCQSYRREMLPFEKLPHWSLLSQGTQKIVKEWLNPHPFQEIKRKYTELKGSFRVRVNPDLLLELNSIGTSRIILSTLNNPCFFSQYRIPCYWSSFSLLAESGDLIPVYRQSLENLLCVKASDLASQLNIVVSREQTVETTLYSIAEKARQLLLTHQKTKIIDYIAAEIFATKEQIQEMVFAAFDSQPGDLKQHILGDVAFFVGKTVLGDVIVGSLGERLIQDEMLFVFSNFASKNKSNLFVLKRAIRAELEHEQSILQSLHEDGATPYLALPYHALNYEEGNALQVRGGKNLSVLINQKGRPSVEFLLQCMDVFYAKMQEKGFADLTVRLKDFVLSSDRESIIKVNFKNVFVLKDVNFGHVFYDNSVIPVEASRWLSILLSAYENQEEEFFFQATMQVLGVEQGLSMEEKKSYLQKKYQDTLEKIMIFQRGSIVFEYLVGKIDTSFYSVIEIKENKQPKLTQTVGGEIRASQNIHPRARLIAIPFQVLFWLSAEPFIEMEEQSRAVLSIVDSLQFI